MTYQAKQHSFILIKRLLVGFAVGVLVYLLSLLGHFTFEKYTPVSYWVDYKSTFSTGEIVEGNISMRSNSAYPRGGEVQWLDRLWCDVPPNTSFKIFSTFIDTATIPTRGYKETGWLYKGDIPSNGSSCYMESIVTVKTPYGISKVEYQQSNTFVIGG